MVDKIIERLGLPPLSADSPRRIHIDDITTEDALVHYLRTTPCMELQVQEVGADTVQRYSVPVRR